MFSWRREGSELASDFGVFFASDRLPTIAEWERAAVELGVRLRVTPTDLRSHEGFLPVAFDSDVDNAGFEFRLRSDWGRNPAFADLLRDRDLFAHFKCFARGTLATVWAAVSFAAASGGVFTDEMGTVYPTLEEAIAYARQIPSHGPEFFLDGDRVGLFLGTDGPRAPGRYLFLPESGRGYDRFRQLQRDGARPRCDYTRSGERVTFTVLDRPESIALELGDFEFTRLEDG